MIVKINYVRVNQFYWFSLETIFGNNFYYQKDDIQHFETFKTDKLSTENFHPCFYRGISIDASYQVSVHLAKHFQKRRFF
jgi:hypothetical protein